VHIWETWETVQIWEFLGNLLCDDFPMFRMVDAGRHKINCWVPESLWEKVEALGYDSPTKATVAGYEALIGKGDTEEEWDDLGNNWEDMGKQLEEAQRQIKDYEEKLRTAPDPVELAELKGLYAGTQKVIDEKDKRIEALEREVSRLDMFAHYFKNVEVKQIEAPIAEKVKPWYKFW
jgi:hypothetical protein